MLFVDLNRSFIQARKLVGFFHEAIFANWWGMELYKAMSDRAERFPLVTCSRAETFSILNCAFLWSLLLINVAMIPYNTEHLLIKEFNI